jgi:signal transduction histidine kinase
MATEKIHERLSALFGNIERLVNETDSISAQDCPEVVTFQIPAQNQEVVFLHNEQDANPEVKEEVPVRKTASSEGRLAAPPLLYEKEQVGYSYAGGKLEPIQGSSFSGLDSSHMLHSSLTATGQPIGAVYVEPPPQHPWTEEEAQLAEEIAQRASLQIQNLRLLASAERARVEAQSASRRFTHESWQSFLDGIHQNERIGYAYDEQGVTPCIDPPPANADFQESVDVLDEQVGRLIVEANPDRPISAEDKTLIAAVAHQVGQQVENLRLLADASRARAEAEDATRRLTREGWQKYAGQTDETMLGFVYDSNQVSPLEKNSLPLDVNIVQPLTVRGEIIGQLAVAGWEDDMPGASSLVAAIAAQTSIHLETLRLNEELQKRAAELQELDRLKSSFLANMSHELRTPLNSILGFSDVILEGMDGPLTDNMENDLHLIQKNGQILLHLINDVLDMAKIESGRMNLHPEKFKVQDLLEEVTSITSNLANAKKLSLFVEPDSDKALEIFADDTRIRQVMMNLVNNSIKFTETGIIALRAVPLDYTNILISVRDTGIGVPPDQLEIIFQEFSQVDTSTTRKVGGTGLGLPISRRLVEMHGGHLWVESTGVAGEGSTFFIELPRVAIITETVENIVK